MAFDAEIRDALIEQVRRFVTEKCVPAEADVSENDEVPQSIVDEMKSLGLFGIAFIGRFINVVAQGPYEGWMVPMAVEGFHCIVIIIAIRAWGSGQAAAA